MCSTILTFSPWKNDQSFMWVFLNFVEVCSCFYSNFLINFWIRINFIGVYQQTILLLHLRRTMMLTRDSKCKQWRIRRGYRWGKSRWWRALWAEYSWILIFLLTLRLSKYMSKNHIQVCVWFFFPLVLWNIKQTLGVMYLSNYEHPIDLGSCWLCS